MTASQIIPLALENLKALVPLNARWIPQKRTSGGRVVLKIKELEIELNAFVKEEVKVAMLPRILEQAAVDAALLVIAGRLQPKVKEALRAAGIAYLESNGNFFLRQHPVYFFIDTQPALKTILPAKGAFTATEVKMLFLLLTTPGLLGKTYREIAAQTEASLGTVRNLFAKMDQQRWVAIKKLGTAQTATFQNREGLLQAWITAFGEKLQPGLQAGQFRFLDKDGLYNWKNLPLKDNSWWGGEPAADLWTGDLRPGNLTLYSREDRLTLMRRYKLVPDPGGHLTLLHPFWPPWADSKEKTVSPLLVYAELLLTGDARCIETALKIYEQTLTPLLV